MAPTLSDIQQLADRMFPFEYVESWDNSGIQVGDPSRSINAIAFSLNASIDAVGFAVENCCDLLVSHHPLLMKPIKKVLASDITGRTIFAAVRSGVDILSLHTNLDAAEGGLNDYLANALDLLDIRMPNNARCSRLGRLAEPETLSDLAHKLCRIFNLDSVRVVGRVDRSVASVFLVSGSGMGYLEDAISAKADVLITGDVRYHGALDSGESNICVIDAGHFGLEKFAIKLIQEKFEAEFSRLGWKIRLCPFEGEKDPFTYIRFEERGGIIN
jgi:GTP cyclohydrolase I